jgi:hypothetical protein
VGRLCRTVAGVERGISDGEFGRWKEIYDISWSSGFRGTIHNQQSFAFSFVCTCTQLGSPGPGSEAAKLGNPGNDIPTWSHRGVRISFG